MAPRPDVSQERITQILEAAVNVFARAGLHNARMDDIAEEAGLSKGAIYWYFDSKDEIIITILDNLFQREMDDMRALQSTERTASQRLMDFATHAMQDVIQVQAILPIAYEFISASYRRDEVSNALEQYYNSYMEILIPIIQEGIDQGEFRPEDPEEIAIAVGTVFEGTLNLWAYNPKLVDPQRHVLSSMRLLLEGIKT
jgi:TetR/AcrR family fatty acid metabolism transcriptional regulator